MMATLATILVIAKAAIALIITIAVCRKVNFIWRFSVPAIGAILTVVFLFSLLAVHMAIWLVGWALMVAVVIFALVIFFKAHGAITRKTKNFIRSEKAERR